jgi:hypothetical protein
MADDDDKHDYTSYSNINQLSRLSERSTGYPGGTDQSPGLRRYADKRAKRDLRAAYRNVERDAESGDASAQRWIAGEIKGRKDEAREKTRKKSRGKTR